MQTFDFIMMEIMLITMSIISIWYLEKSRKNKKRLIVYSMIGGMVGLFVGIISDISLDIGIITACILLCALCAETVQLFFLATKNREHFEYYDDGTPARFYITGDKHRDFDKVRDFCRDMKTRKRDVMIILGDSGFNYFSDKRDERLKADISLLNITLFCLHGNKEKRPQNISTYGIRSFCGGKVYYEPKYPNIVFGIDGEIYTFEGHDYMVIGGAHSVDKLKCIEKGLPYWADEMPDDETKKNVENKLAENKNTIYGMLTHTCPIKYLPTEMFMSTIQNTHTKRKDINKNKKNLFNPDIDRSTEEWLDEIEEKIDYRVWFCGHYHVDKEIDKLHMMHSNIKPLHLYLNEVKEWDC